jgi:hypothetical protein
VLQTLERREYTLSLNGLFGPNSIYEKMEGIFGVVLSRRNQETMVRPPDLAFDVILKIFKKMENPATFLDGMGGHFLCCFLKTSKEEKIFSYFRKVLENEQDYEICLVTEVVRFIRFFEIEEFREFFPRSSILNGFRFVDTMVRDSRYILRNKI